MPKNQYNPLDSLFEEIEEDYIEDLDDLDADIIRDLYHVDPIGDD